ncbi:conserved hypothetical protein [Lodderomyces elongisporus NRRL YB-4239]|uniref:Alpha-1,3-mannosyltransferase n=1 Tax=Lodderomyces elongisporus (strain ATCC 11503 / CBS 2605 / JCM 1781 / NBRC 1676 / NRRL YB-4239) TaxID=379508 RepID=A5E1M5_LODEL|nr:conserved hypothetical protein [Lodderomyces elongisporus NRRL YB-4239]
MIEKITTNRSQQRVFLYSGICLWLLAINIWLYYSYHSKNSTFITPNLDQSSIYDQYDPSNIYTPNSGEEDLTPDNKKENNDKKISNNNNKKKPAQTKTKTKPFKDDITIKVLQKHISSEKDQRGIDAHALIYNTIFANHEIDSIFGNLDFQQRCDLFFQNLFLDDKNWIFKINEKITLENKLEFKYNDYKRVHMDKFKKDFAEKNSKDANKIEDDDHDFDAFVREKYDEFWTKTMEYEQKIVDHVSILRVFNKCYLTSDNSTQIKQTNEFINTQHKLIRGISQVSKTKNGVTPFTYTQKENLINFKTIKHSAFEHRVYPWLSLENPIYERFTGERTYGPPQMSKYLPNDPSQKVTKTHQNEKNIEFFLQKFRNSCNGRGIVLSIGDDHVDETVRLIQLLRALSNTLPIQIVYYDDLSVKTKRKIVSAARENIGALPKSFEKVREFFNDDYLSHEGGLPQQEIWFVNTYNAIHEDFKEKFKGFANKFLATFFNSFDEFMLIDADTVMMQNPEYFFNLEKYKETGTFFYKDRTSEDTRPPSDSMFFKKLSPSIVDSVMFNIPIMTKYTYDNDFFNGLFHYMESGLVMLNRRIHFNSLLMMLQLNFYQPVNERIHGDKEIFWLAFAINGNENYYFDSNYAAAIGQITPPSDWKRPDGTIHRATELCSPHPGHVSEIDNALVWINSGFVYCSKAAVIDFQKEADHKARLKLLNTAEQFKEFYNEPLRISAAVIPPFDYDYKGTNKEDEPTRGWLMDGRYCNSYMWCAYSSISGLQEDGKDDIREGRVIKFSEKEQNLFDYYGDVWVGLE